MGGRANVAHVLGGAKVIPGKWELAIEFDEVKQLQPRMNDGQSLPKNKSQKCTQDVSTIQQSHGNPDGDGMNDTQTAFVTIRNSSAKLTRLVSLSSDKHFNSTKSQAKEFWSKEKTVKNM